RQPTARWGRPPAREDRRPDGQTTEGRRSTVRTWSMPRQMLHGATTPHRPASAPALQNLAGNLDPGTLEAAEKSVDAIANRVIRLSLAGPAASRLSRSGRPVLRCR